MNNISALDFLAFDAVEQNETRNNDVFTSLVSLASYALVKDEQPVSNIDLVKIVSAHSNSLNRNNKHAKNRLKVCKIASEEVVESFQNESDYIKAISESYKRRQLILFLGAGISIESGLPNWSRLLKDITDDLADVGDNNKEFKTEYLLSKFSPLIYANMLCERSKEKEKTINFKRYVRKNLYKNFCRQDNCNLTINEITNLCGNKNHRPYSIITYNYDDLLENSLKLHNPPIPFKSIHQGGIPIDDFLPIYHVHGFIPQKGNISKEMVLLENEYHLLYADDSDWRNRNQTTAITEFNCLFIGNSLTDPNLRRLLYKAINKANSEKKNHYLIELIPKDVELNDEKLIREYKAMKQSDANSFGIKILWANDKSEIPLKLKMIREISTVNGVL